MKTQSKELLDVLDELDKRDNTIRTQENLIAVLQDVVKRLQREKAEAVRFAKREFQVGDYLEHHLVGTVTKVENWGLYIETVDQRSGETSFWTIDPKEDTDWHPLED